MINRYINYLVENKYSSKTLITYKNVLNIFKYEINNIELVKHKLVNLNRKNATFILYFNVLSSYYKWLGCDTSLNTLKTLKIPQLEQRYMNVLGRDEIVLKTAILINDDKLTIKFKNLIQFLFFTGIRYCELATIHQISQDTLFVVGKANKVREVFHKIDITNKILQDKDMKYIELNNGIKRILGNKYTLHTLRRSFATHMLLSGANPKMVMLQLGHKSIETTFRYLNLSKENNKNIYEKYM